MLKHLIIVLITTLAFSQTQDYRITLGGKTFDPLQVDRSSSKTESDSPYDCLQLVQLWGPGKPENLAFLENQGLEIVQYIYPNAYVVWGKTQSSKRLAKNDVIRFVGPFSSEYRLLPAYRTQSRSLVNMRALAYNGRSHLEIKNQLKNLNVNNMKLTHLDKRFTLIEGQISGSMLPQVAAIRGIYTVQIQPEGGGSRSELSSQLNVNGVDLEGKAVLGYQAWLTTADLTGDGVTVAIVDEGSEQTHDDFSGRMQLCIGDSCEDTASIHGTHVAGIVGGDGASGVVDEAGFLRGLGVAPGINMIEQIYGSLINTPAGMYQLITESYRNGASISNNSWGPASIPLGYDMDTMMVDIGVRDADPDQAGNQEFTYVLSIMNGYGTNIIDDGEGGTIEYPSLGTPDESKNLIKVGSTFAQQPTGEQALDVDSVSTNSAHGPALDGRTVPDLVAPGSFVDATSVGNGYRFLSGTSMAAPQVAGAAALFTEYYKSLLSNPLSHPPSPAMTKAAIVIASKNLVGGNDADANPLGHRPDSKQGWGRLMLHDVVTPQTEAAYFDNPQIFTATNDVWEILLNIDDPNQPLKVMLAWTDAPGHGLGGETPAWNNNLDLEVDYDGNTYLGNVLDGGTGWSIPAGTPDHMNNLEAVILGPTVTAGLVTIRVKATDLNSDGIPGNAELTDQDFSIVCMNCSQTDDFELLTTTESVNICSPNNAEFNLSLAQIGNFADPVTLSTSGLPKGVTPSFADNPITTGSTSLTLSTLDGLPAGDYPFTVTGTAGENTFDLPLTLTVTLDPGAAPLQTAPEDESKRLPQQPTFSWDPVSDALSYRLEIATDEAFTQLAYTSDMPEASHQPTSKLTYATLFYWRVASTNVCGQGDFSETRSFTVVEAPDFLLVDDDMSGGDPVSGPDVRNHYTDALDSWGILYDIWDVATEGSEPTAAQMAVYDNVLWFSGNAPFSGVPYSGPSAASETELATYLDNGGNVIIFSQNYLQQMGAASSPTTFMTDYLDVTGITSRLTYSHLLGETGATNFDGLGPFPYGPAAFPENSSDVQIGSEASIVLTSSNGYDTGIFRTNGTYSVMLMNFSLNGLNDAAAKAIMRAVLNTFNIALLNDRLPDWPDGESVLTLVTRLNELYAEKAPK